MFCLEHFSVNCIIKMSNLKVNDPLKLLSFEMTWRLMGQLTNSNICRTAELAEICNRTAVTCAAQRSYTNSDSGVGITPQICNRVTNHGDVSTFSKPGCGDVGARCGDVCVWGSNVGDCAEVIRCDDIGARCGDVVAGCGDLVARSGDVGDRAELPAISARSFR